MQRWHVNSLGTVLCETIATVSLSAPPAVMHIRRWADISHITSYRCWATAVGGVGGRLRRLARISLYRRCMLLTIFYKIDIGNLLMPIRQCSSMLRCCRFLMSDVYIGQTLIITDGNVFTLPAVGVWSIVISVSVSVCLYVCLSVCPLAYLNNHMSELHNIFCAC